MSNPVDMGNCGGGSSGAAFSCTDLALCDTDDLAEGSSNQYYTNERVDDRAAALIQNGTGISWSYNDGAGTLTPTVTLAPFNTGNLSEGSNLYYTDERVDDRVASLLQNGGGLTWTYNDGAGTLTPAIDHGGIGGLSDNDHPQYALATAVTTQIHPFFWFGGK